MESIKKTIYIVFNKHNGIIFSHEEDKNVAKSYNPEHFLIKEVELLPNEYYFGDYETGKIFNSEERPLIREDDIEENFYEKIHDIYSPLKQLIIILDVIKNNENIKTTPEFDRLYDFIDTQRTAYKEQLEVVSSDKDSFNFISIKEVADITQKRIQGIVL